jgi:hypothetical protein
VTNQQTADLALAQWQALRNAGLAPEQRIERLMSDFFAPIPPGDAEYDVTLNSIAEIMAAA